MKGGFSVAIADSGAVRRLPERAVPTRWDALLFRFKTNVFRMDRTLRELGRAPPRLAQGDASGFVTVVAESRTALWSDPRSSERTMQWGKVQNLRAAARRLDRTMLPVGAVFSFWRQLGRASTRRGFVAGRMLQEGCLVPATGGGLCQLSNALYDVALETGCRIVERHGHSRIVPGSSALRRRDATVAWNYVDLRFAAPREMMLRVIVERDALVVRLLGREVMTHPETSLRGVSTSPFRGGAGDATTCGTCEETICFRQAIRSSGEDREFRNRSDRECTPDPCEPRRVNPRPGVASRIAPEFHPEPSAWPDAGTTFSRNPLWSISPSR